MNYLPVFMDLQDQPVVLVGAGAVAERKARLLLKAGARLYIIARSLNPRFHSWLESGQADHLAEAYSPGLLKGARLVFSATGDKVLNRQVFEEAESLGIPVNVVDDPSLCRFISPAVVDRSPVQVAISTGGSSPVLARRIRSWIEALLPQGLGRVAQAAGAVRRQVMKRVPASRRREFWENLLSDSSIQAWSTSRGGRIRQQILTKASVFARQAKQTDAKRGRVYLVGAGPGRADLLTLRALQVLGQADVVLHDRLVSDEVLDLVRRDADFIDVGKRAGGRKSRQSDIHRLMVEEAERGRNVVRLKGGDPFVFGRGGEELEHLQAHKVEYEVVPGITAALGCAAYAGIPLTHRDHAQALTLLTGHTASFVTGDANEVRPLDWASCAGPGKTAVVYMGVRQAGNLRRQMIEAGLSADLPVALVANGTLDKQKVFNGTVGELDAMAARAGSDNPGLLIIGQVAALGSTLGWFGADDLSASSTFRSAA